MTFCIVAFYGFVLRGVNGSMAGLGSFIARLFLMVCVNFMCGCVIGFGRTMVYLRDW